MEQEDKLSEYLRQPEYTGENRCLPCTVVNSIIAVALAAGIAVLWLPAGVAALAVFAAAIYLRGYLVPGTPELTQRYFPVWLLRAFGKEPFEGVQTTDGGVEATEADADRPDRDEAERLLRAGDVVEDCPHEDDLCLTAAFREVWWRRIRTYRDDDGRAAAQLATVLDIDPEELSFVNEGEYFGVEFTGELIGRWDSDAAFYADLAAEPTLAEWLSDWDNLGDRTRTELLAGMRAFLEECPACEAELDQVENVRQSCCAGEMVSVSVDCSDCGARVFSGSYA
jgi:RNase P subunit RPR2